MKVLEQSLIAAIKNDGGFELSRIDKTKISFELRKFKTETGSINFPAIFSIPKEDRIAAMAKKDFYTTVQTISVAIALALESINLKRPMTNGQIFDLAETIIEDAESDNLCLEDVMLFLQKFIRGEYSELYDSIDVPKFMHRFGEYRDFRWNEGVRLRDEKNEYYKTLGETKRSVNNSGAFGEYLSKFTTKVQALKDEVAEQKAINKRQKNNF